MQLEVLFSLHYRLYIQAYGA